MTKRILISIVLGFILTILPMILALLPLFIPELSQFKSAEGTYSKVVQFIVLWNFFAAGTLAFYGLLSNCADCELLSLGYALINSFFVGLLGYSFAVFTKLTILKTRKQKRENVAGYCTDG